MADSVAILEDQGHPGAGPESGWRVPTGSRTGAHRDGLHQLDSFGPLVGNSPCMRDIYEQIARVAPTEARVCITGETGTGKGLVAETIHSLSPRHEGPFLPVNCGAISPDLSESELFGHERGSFTGADRRHVGVFELAAGGTLFMDEITAMPPELQVRLLRALETASLRRGISLKTLHIRLGCYGSRLVPSRGVTARRGGV